MEPVYQQTRLKRGSKALELWEQWQKTKQALDKKKLDLHMADVDRRYKELLCGK